MMSQQTITLNGEWMVLSTPLSEEGETGLQEVGATLDGWMSAMVPGEIHLDLLRAGRMADPEISDNARSSRWPEEHAWWYRTTFQITADFIDQERQQLIADGLECNAQLYLNGQPIGLACNAFVEHTFDIRGAVQAGENELLVRLTAGTELIKDRDRLGEWFDEPIYALRNLTQQRYLRKPQYEYGWDWNDPLPNIGIWRGMRVEARSHAVIHEFRLDTVMQDAQVFLTGQAILENLHPWTERPCVFEVIITPPAGEPILTRISCVLPMSRTALPLQIAIPDPQLWWPNGMGEQPLYQVTARVLHDEVESDRLQQTIGLRTVEIDRTPLPDGSRFCIRVNGQQVFCRGGNWAPSDMIPARVTPERYEALVGEAKNAHFTMFRLNGVGYYEDDAFFDACDRAGILLWQDFTFACMTYPDHDPAFRAAVRDEAEAVVRRLRHHPSLALWCGCNESIWLNSGGKDPYTLGGIRLFGQVLPDVCRQLDPLRPYWPCSPYGGDEPNSESSGNNHWWYPFFMNPNVNRRIRHEVVDECRARFVSEYGIIGPPHLDSVREYLKPEEQSRETPAWKIHTNTFEHGTVAEGIRYHYGDPDNLSLPDYLLYGQLYQALMHGGAMEALRFRKSDPDAECWGALIWSYNDCWGEMGWSVIDHYLRRKASYYWLRRACSPVKVIIRPREDRLVVRIVNDTLRSYDAELQHGWFRVDGTDRQLTTQPIAIPSNGMVEIARVAIQESLSPREWIYGAILTGDGFPADQAVWLMAPYRELALSASNLSITARDNALEIVSPVFCHAIHIDDGGHEVLSDNYFDLLPGIPRIITEKSPMSQSLQAVLPVAAKPMACSV
ncbi:MAG: glycoside hydrolase family 2 protein [Armatimonadota bacterium]